MNIEKSNIEKFLLIAIDSTQLVMKVEKMLLENEINVRIIPLPKEIKASCGLSIKADLSDVEKAARILEKNEIEENLYSFYIVEKKGLKKEVKILNKNDIVLI